MLNDTSLVAKHRKFDSLDIERILCLLAGDGDADGDDVIVRGVRSA